MPQDYSNKVNNTIAYLDRTFEFFKKSISNSTDDLLKSHIAKYLTILTYGSYESVIKDMLRDFVDYSSKSEWLSHFANDTIDNRYQNLNFSELRRFLGSFNKEWSERLYQKTDSLTIQCFSNITTQKNNIAHDPSKCDITFTTICDYYENSKWVIKYVGGILDDPKGLLLWVSMIDFWNSFPEPY